MQKYLHLITVIVLLNIVTVTVVYR